MSERFYKAGIIVLSLVLVILGFYLVQAAYSGNIIGFVWSEKIGWLDFTNSLSYGVAMSGTGLDGYAWSEKTGYISLKRDAETPDYGVTMTLNGSVAQLSGYAWGPQTGYINFAAPDSDYTNTLASNYGVSIDGATGVFSGYAWGEKIGWLKMSGACSNGTTDACSSGTYGLVTTWRDPTFYRTSSGSLESSTFDLGSISAVINFLMWQGTQPTDTAVKFQIASGTTSAGPWLFIGPDGTNSSYYISSGPGVPIKVRQENHLYHRYMRYKVFLYANSTITASPTVDDVIVNFTK